MSTPARQHYLRVTASQAAQAQANPLRHATGQELMLAQMAEHKRSLKQIQSIERKADFKRAVLAEYEPWVEGVLQSDSGLQDDVFMTVMVWRIDVGDFARALPMAEYAIRHGLSMPDQYQRTTACLIAEEFATMAIKAASSGQPVDLEALRKVGDLVSDQDMPDEVRAKFHKAVGYANYAQVAQATGEQAISLRRFVLEHLQRALELNERVGVKKDIERIERDIKNLAKPAQQDGTS